MFPRQPSLTFVFMPFMEAAGIEPAQDSPGHRLSSIYAGEALAVVGAECWLYFVSGADLVKIGITSGYPAKRFGNLCNGSPSALVLSAVQPGSRAQEQQLHEEFDAQRSHGEWFRPCDELAGRIRAARDRYGCPDPATGIPQHLLRLSLLNVVARDEARQLSHARLMEARRLYVEVGNYIRQGEQIPYELECRWRRTSALLGAVS